MERDGINRTGARYAISLTGALVLLAACAAGAQRTCRHRPGRGRFLVGFLAGADQSSAKNAAQAQHVGTGQRTMCGQCKSVAEFVRMRGI